MNITPHYFITIGSPENECHDYICKWIHGAKDEEQTVLGKGYVIILECHDKNSLKLCNMLNKVDKCGEEF